jgi:hypothetical protein
MPAPVMISQTIRQSPVCLTSKANSGVSTPLPTPPAAMNSPMASARRRANQLEISWVPGMMVCIARPSPRNRQER